MRARLFEGAPGHRPLPMLWPCAVDHGADWPDNRGRPVRPADLHVVRNVQVGGHGAQPVIDGAYLHAGPAFPVYVQAYIDQELAADRWRFDPGRLKARPVKRGWALIHFNLMYGHWLTEVFPKLFAIRALAEAGVQAPILLPSSAPAFVQPTIEDVLPGQPVEVYDPELEFLQVEQLLLPPMLGEDYVYHPALSAALGAYAAARRTANAPTRLFVSRGGMRTDWAYREMVNETEIEAAAEAAGFAIVRPETRSWREQVGMFAGARVIAGEFGSGLHNTLFSPRGAAVVSFNWITDIQSLIGDFKGQRVGYVLPDDGRPRRFSLEHSLQPFRIDAGEARRRLADAIEAVEIGASSNRRRA